MPRYALAVAGLLTSFTVGTAARHDAERIAPNDNRQSAGELHGSVLSVRLEARNGMWFPEGENGVGVETAAWAEVGKPLANPGPIIRVTAGDKRHRDEPTTSPSTLMHATVA